MEKSKLEPRGVKRSQEESIEPSDFKVSEEIKRQMIDWANLNKLSWEFEVV